MATTYLSPLGNEQQNDANGAPLSGGKIWTYAAGTTNLIATYQDNAGSVSQANPIVLNTSGLPANPIWLPAGQAVKMVFQDVNGVPLRTVDNITGINDPSGVTAADQWVIYTGAPTFISSTSFSIAGDQRNTFQIGRRIRTANSGGTVYSTITNSIFGALTTVTVTNDSGVLDSGLSQASYALLSAVSPSLPDSAAARASAGLSTGYASTAATPGGITLPNWLGGFGIRWGSVTTSASADVTATFSTPFSSSFYAANITVANGGGSGSTVASLGSTGVSGINIGAYVSSTGARATATVYYLAIGK